MRDPFTPTIEQRESVREILRDLKGQFLMSAWQFQHFYPSKDKKSGPFLRRAMATCSPEYHTLEIGIYPAFFRLDRDEQRETLMHEIVHAVLERLVRMIYSVIEKGHLVTGDHFRDVNESTAEWITNIIACMERSYREELAKLKAKLPAEHDDSNSTEVPF